MSAVKDLLTSAIRRMFDREILSSRVYKSLCDQSEELDRCKPKVRDYELLRSLSHDSAAEVLRLFPMSHSQLRQDLFVLSELDFKKSGYFVEFGATNGIDLSNSWLLEKHYGWHGILAEPAKGWHADLKRNRECSIEHRCVWSSSGDTLQFAEVSSAPELSTLQAFADGDRHKSARALSDKYEVKTISLVDLLEFHNAPRDIDYLSIDTEGSEFDILAAFDFERFRIKVITVEHNFTGAREKLRILLEAHGYSRKLTAVSDFDDWYVLSR